MAVDSDDHFPVRDNGLACKHGMFDRLDNTAAARDGHTSYCYAQDVVLLQNRSKLLGIEGVVIQLRTADNDNMIPYKVLVEPGIREGCAVCRNQQIGILKKGGCGINQGKLYRPLLEL